MGRGEWRGWGGRRYGYGYWNDGYGTGQYGRRARAMGQRICVLASAGDVHHVLGSRGVTYAVRIDTSAASDHRCTCPDFRKRRMPCKHIFKTLASVYGVDVPGLRGKELNKPQVDAAGSKAEPKLKKKRLEPSTDCVICYDAFDAKELRQACSECGNAFHVDCITSWLKTGRSTCPMCRHARPRWEKVDAEGHVIKAGAPTTADADVPAEVALAAVLKDVHPFSDAFVAMYTRVREFARGDDDRVELAWSHGIPLAVAVFPHVSVGTRAKGRVELVRGDGGEDTGAGDDAAKGKRGAAAEAKAGKAKRDAAKGKRGAAKGKRGAAAEAKAGKAKRDAAEAKRGAATRRTTRKRKREDAPQALTRAERAARRARLKE